jgi:hypothetical protein
MEVAQSEKDEGERKGKDLPLLTPIEIVIQFKLRPKADLSGGV